MPNKYGKIFNFIRRNRLAVWRQLPKLIPAGSTPVSCSTQRNRSHRSGFFFVISRADSLINKSAQTVVLPKIAFFGANS